MSHDQIALLLQVALLGEVSPSLRAAGFSLSEHRVSLLLYYDGRISEDDRESASCIETELIAALPENVGVATEVLRIDAPAQIPAPERWVYWRRE